MQTLKTSHFQLRYDPKNDKILREFMAKYLEEIYDELAKKFALSPEGADPDRGVQQPRDVQRPRRRRAGPAHDRRLHGPHGRDGLAQRQEGIGKPFNWGRVIRHELVHIFNLEQTNFLCRTG